MLLGSQNERKQRTSKDNVSNMLEGRNWGAKNLKKKESCNNQTTELQWCIWKRKI